MSGTDFVVILWVGALLVFSIVVFPWVALPILALLLVWVIASLQTIEPDFVGLRKWFGWFGWELEEDDPRQDSQWFGWLDRKVLKAGLHFVPLFPGVELVLIPKELKRHVFEKEPGKPGWEVSGSMFQVRSRDNQKLNVELSFFFRPPYELVDSLVLMIESGVPLEDELQKDWIEDAIAPDVLHVFGKENYKDVMGGKENEKLNNEINKLLQQGEDKAQKKKDSLLRRSGLFGNGPDDDTPGTGEAFLRIEFVHLSEELGKRLELVETTRLEAEAAKNVRDRGNIETAGRVFLMVAESEQLTPDQLRIKLGANPKLKGLPEAEGGFKEAFENARKQVMLERDNYNEATRKFLVGNPDGTPLSDQAFATLLAGIGAWLGNAGWGQVQQPPGGSNPTSKSGGKKKKPKSKPSDDDDDYDPDEGWDDEDSDDDL